MTIQLNGRMPRKQLSDQLDRFDSLLDGLSEALNETIADAVRDGTRLALKDAVVEILTDPMLRSKLRDAAGPVNAPGPAKTSSFWQSAKARVAAACRTAMTKVATTVASAARAVKSVVAATVTTVKSTVSTIVTFVKIAAFICRPTRLALVSAGAGLAIAAASYFAPHAIAAALSGAVGTAAAFGLRASEWTRRPTRIVG